jgi:hypothetical protein
VLKPLHELMSERILQSRVIHIDDTSVPVLDPTCQTTRRQHAALRTIEMGDEWISRFR